MNRERVQQLLDYMKTVPDERFNYDVFLTLPDGVDGVGSVTMEWIYNDITPPCDCVACLAGHAVLLFNLKSHRIEEYARANPAKVTAEYLDVDDPDLIHDLFYRNSQHATRQDAINRLTHLLEHGSLTDYPFHTEGGRSHE